MEQKKERIQKFIDCFNQDFETKIKSNENVAFLEKLFENFISIYISPKEQAKQLDKVIELENTIYKICNEEQKKVFKEYDKEQEELYSSLQEQAFIYGFCTCKQLNEETKI